VVCIEVLILDIYYITSGNHRLESAGLDAVKGRYWRGSFFYIGEWSEVEGFGKFAIRWHKCAIWDLLYKRRLFIRCLTTYGNSIVMCPKVGFFLRVFDITNHMLSSLPCFNVNEPISCSCLSLTTEENSIATCRKWR